jgi:hypothetical protein
MEMGMLMVIVLNLLAPVEDKTEGTKDRFYKELDHVFDNSRSSA